MTDCGARVKERTCTEAVLDAPNRATINCCHGTNPTCKDCKFKDDCKLGTTSEEGYVVIKNCDRGGRSIAEMLQFFRIPSETTTHLKLWYQCASPSEGCTSKRVKVSNSRGFLTIHFIIIK